MHLVVFFRGGPSMGGLRWPLRTGDEIEVWNDRHEQVATLTATLICAVIGHHLDGLAVQEVVREAMDRKPLAELPSRRPRPPAPFTDEQRTAFRARRRARKR